MAFTIACSTFAALASITFATCGQTDSQHNSNIKHDNVEISKMLDQAILSPSPVDSFQVLLPKIRSYPTVDSAWINGRNFFVQYKGGGVLSWTAPINEQHGEQQK